MTGRIIAGTAIVLIALCGATHALASLDDAPAEMREAVEDNATGFLNDLSARRRTTTLFPNPQPVFSGVQENFVNTSTGSMTFLVRDLVRIGGMPIIMGRVYDSTLEEGGDFGPGWKLTVVEEVQQEGSQLLFTDASNGVHRLDVSGDKVMPESPATAPIVSGSTRTTGGEAGIVVLESADGMLRRFKQDGDVWRLVHVRHGRGWVRLEWRRGTLTEVTSDAGWVRFSRRDDGRISGITDDIGRTVGYSYDSDGRLTGVTDLAGESWSLGYASDDLLSSITDPRNKVVLAATWTDTKVSRIRVLRERTDFAYAGNATTATDALGRDTVYRRDDSGITDSITDRTGATTEVGFDAGHRPVTVTRDNATVARIGYDENGDLATLWQTSGETEFTTNNRGEVTVASGAWTARYRYSDRRVVHASDSGGERDYRYTDAGLLSGATINGVDTTMRSNADGALTELARGVSSLAMYVYDSGGRVSSIDYGEGRTATFEYDARGFRTAAEYSYGSDDQIEASMSYDAAGNLTRMERGMEGEEPTEHTYEIGDYNEVVRVRAGDGEDAARPDLTFEYDAAGRVQRSTLGSREAAVEYDSLDRATRVTVDGETILERDYRPDDPDAARQEDRRTGGVLVVAPVSPVFGTMESIVYSRPRATEFGIVAYSPTRRTFEVRPDALAADALLLGSLHARMVPLDGSEPNPAPFGHDKPSSSLFIPPEFRAVNCEVCVSFVFDVDLDVTPAGEYCYTNYTADVDGYCFDALAVDTTILGDQHRWRHSTSFGDGSWAHVTTYSGVVSGSHKYTATGRYTMTHYVNCTCPSAFAHGSDSESFSVPGGILACTPPRCTLDISVEPDSPAISTAPAMPTVTATASNVTPSHATVSWTARVNYTAPSRVCSGGPQFPSSTVSGRGKTFSPSLGGPYGGALTITATCSALGHTSSEVSKTVTVNGTQPSISAIVAKIGSVESPFDSADLRRIACKESPGLKQFQPSPGPPVFGRGGDVGIMQICYQRTAEHVWNWQSNIDRGKAILMSAKPDAKRHLDREAAKDGATPYPTRYWREEAIHRYNAGWGTGNEYWVWIPAEGDVPAMWKAVDRGGIGGYVSGVLGQSATCR